MVKCWKKTGNTLETYYAGHRAVIKSVFTGGEWDPLSDRFASGELRLIYCNGTERALRVMPSPNYGFPYGVPISEDGEVFYVPGWQNGTRAYSADEGKIQWRSRVRRCRDIIPYGNTLLTISADRRLVKFSAETGEMIDAVKTASGKDRIFDLSPNYVMVCTRDCHLGILNKDSLSEEQKFENELLQSCPVADVIAVRDGLLILTLERGGEGYRLSSLKISLSEQIVSDIDEKSVDERLHVIRRLFSV